LALGIICLIVWGYRMWWLRRPTRTGATTPGGSQRPSTTSIGIIGAVAIGLGIFFPVLGASLLAFLAGDALWQETRRRRTTECPVQ
jgi:uncharacterized iron-regulated membrane protein